jgi:hypothetical protein
MKCVTIIQSPRWLRRCARRALTLRPGRPGGGPSPCPYIYCPMTMFKRDRDWCILPSKRPPGWKTRPAGDMRAALRRNPNAATLFKHLIELEAAGLGKVHEFKIPDILKAEAVAASEAPLTFNAPFLMPPGSTIEQLAEARRSLKARGYDKLGATVELRPEDQPVETKPKQ